MSIELLTPQQVSQFVGMKTVKRADAVRNCLRQFNIDDTDTAFFTRQQEQILQTPFMTEYADIKFRQILPVSNEINNGATEWTYRQYDESGRAGLITDMSADFPTVDIKGAELTSKIKSFGTSYHYSVQDLRASQFAGSNQGPSVPIETMRAQAARRVMERLLDKLVAVGDSKLGFSTGLVNDSNILSFTKMAQSIGTTWQDSNGVMLASPNEILADIHGACQKIFETTKGLHAANTQLVGTKGYSFLAGKPQSPTFTDQSIMSYLLRMSPWIKQIQHWPQLDTAGGSSKERIVVMEKNPDVARVMIPQEFEQFPPLPVNLSFKILCHMRYAGVAVFRPAAICYVDGTQP